jgi:hypothetical protein
VRSFRNKFPVGTSFSLSYSTVIVCEVATISRVTEFVCFLPFSSVYDPKTCVCHGNWVDMIRDETSARIVGNGIQWFEIAYGVIIVFFTRVGGATDY